MTKPKPKTPPAPPAPLEVRLLLFVDRDGIAQSRITVEGKHYEELVGPTEAARHIGRLVLGWLAYAVLRAAAYEHGEEPS